MLVMETSITKLASSRSFLYLYLNFVVVAHVPVRARTCVSSTCDICRGTPRITITRCLACFTIGMQHANLIQTPGRHLLARGASLQRARRTSAIRSCAALGVPVPQATPQPKVEERKTYLGLVSPAHLHRKLPHAFEAYLHWPLQRNFLANTTLPGRTTG